MSGPILATPILTARDTIESDPVTAVQQSADAVKRAALERAGEPSERRSET
jgi:hypothetical protein